MGSRRRLSRAGVRWLSRVSLGATLTALWACDTKPGAGADAGALDAKGDGGVSEMDLGDAASPCDRFFAAKYGLTQPGQSRCAPSLPAAETARIRARFERVCQYLMALPGSGMTEGAMQACGSALESAAAGCCTLAACDIRGSLAGGAQCNDDSQCASGVCTGTNDDSCGTCRPAARLGQPCFQPGGCVPGGACFALTPNAPQFTCLPVTVGPAGALCDGLGSVCAAGLYCDPDASTCSPPGQVGDGCEARPCARGLHCWGPTRVCRPLAKAGEPCGEDCDCNPPDLGCSSSQQCHAMTWVAPGGTCLPPDRRCLIGLCPSEQELIPPPLTLDGGSISNKCPSVIPDGEPCDDSDTHTTCDTFSQCFQGTCAPIDAVVCR